MPTKPKLPFAVKDAKLRKRMRSFLIAQGAEGFAHKRLIDRFKCKTYPREHVLSVLERWERDKLVERFTIRVMWSKGPITMWRATNDIRDPNRY